MIRAAIFAWLHDLVLSRTVDRRDPDFVIGGQDDPYLMRWWLTPWRGWADRYGNSRRMALRALAAISEILPNAYVHLFLRSDDDRALHDHPWASVSIILAGSYTEHEILAGGIHRRTVLKAGDVRVRWSGKAAHRIELHEGPCTTLFLTGPRYRDWGFHCALRGWVPWREFTADTDRGAIGRGCD